MPKSVRPRYATNVFINCPFDREYEPILHAIAFAVIDCGFTVRCALAAEDTSPTRIDRLYQLIGECRFGIHDLSRIQQDADSGLPRFNMPFELGLFLAAGALALEDTAPNHAWFWKPPNTTIKSSCPI